MNDRRKFEFTTNGRHRLGVDWERLAADDIREKDKHFATLIGLAGSAPDWAHDLLLIAQGVYLADKRFRRDTVADQWTRTIDLAVQVVTPERWSSSLLNDMSALLGVLTGDRWTLSVHGGAIPPQALDFDPPAGQVILFSGGIDSTCYMVHAAHQPGSSPLLVLSFDAYLKGRRAKLRALADLDAVRNIQPCEVALTAAGDRTGRELEQSSRSRGLLYLAGAVYQAAAHRMDAVMVPENGQLAVNPPLTPGRLGALSTRSVHPWTIDRLNRVITSIGGDVTITNPLLGHTKGEVCSLVNDTEFAARGGPQATISCGSTRRRVGHDNCGYCFPCLVRRSGLLAAFGTDTTGYHSEVADLSPHARNARDLRALMRWLSQPFSIRDLVVDTPFPASVPISTVMPTLRRGRAELAAMIEHLVPSDSALRCYWSPHDRAANAGPGPVGAVDPRQRR